MGGLLLNWTSGWNRRFRSILVFSFLSAYILSFLFEGQILYRLLAWHSLQASNYIVLAISAHFLGLFTGWLFAKSALVARVVMLFGMGISFLSVIPFFFAPSPLWSMGLIFGGYASGAALAAWGYFLKAFTPKQERLKTCADVLIWSNIIMVVINVLTLKVSPFLGLAMVMLCLFLGLLGMWTLDAKTQGVQHENQAARARGKLKNAFFLLCFFITILTINSGLMYQVINPAFEHMSSFPGWYWSIPYIVALFVLRNLPGAIKHSNMVYGGMAMMMGAFLGFMFLGRNSLDYLVVDTLLLAACGIFDLFWWSILGEMLDYTENPSRIFGLGLSANVLGVLSGGAIGFVATTTQRLSAEVTVMALTVICITLAILPLLNRHLVLLLKHHAYLVAEDATGKGQESLVANQIEALDPLTVREQEVLEQLLSGKSNREIATSLYITESTVKTHVRNIFSKYGMHSRAELISSLLKGDDS